MSQPTQRPRNNNQRRRPQHKRPNANDVWRNPPPLPDAEPITMGGEVGALLRSLGDPPINGGVAIGHYFNSVVERSAAVAVALALSADLLAQPADD